MKTSPFPGVDPYLEPYWSGVHNSMISIFILGAPEHRIPPGKHSIISVWRRITLKWEVYPVALADPLPNFRVPLRSGDCDIILRLQEAFDDNYVNGAYPRRIDYSKDPTPKLSEEADCTLYRRRRKKESQRDSGT